jgi:hypothetical protein
LSTAGLSSSRAARQRVPPDERQTGALAECLERSDLRALLHALLVSPRCRR